MSTKLTSELKEGMVTLSDVYSTTGKLIMPKDTVITNSIINRLVENEVLFVEILEGENVGEAASISFDDLEIQSNNEIKNTPQYKKFSRRYDKAIEDMSEHLNDIVHKNSEVDIDSMVNNTMNIIKAGSSGLNILTMMSTLKNYDDSTFNHSLNVALISNLIGKWLNLPEDEVKLLTACGLFHDIGKLLIPEHIIKKPGKLTDEEYSIIKTHTQKGYELLRKRNVDIHVQYSALMHHEKCDGTGYPLGLIDNQIDWCAQIVTIADIYEAMTAKRVYRGPLSPFTVIKNFEEDGLKKYNPKFLLCFLEHVVNSYMNCKVILSNGQEGDIVYINKVRLSKPLIKTKDNFIDLSKNTDISIEKVF